MSVIPVSQLSGPDLMLLGNNLRPTIRSDRLLLEAINRSLAVQGEEVAKLFRPRRRPARLIIRSRRLCA